MAESNLPNRRGEWVSCESCGRETRATDGICKKCKGGDQEEQIGRKQRSPQVLGGNPIDEGTTDETAAGRYHGSNRDDI